MKNKLNIINLILFIILLILNFLLINNYSTDIFYFGIPVVCYYLFKYMKKNFIGNVIRGVSLVIGLFLVAIIVIELLEPDIVVDVYFFYPLFASILTLSSIIDIIKNNPRKNYIVTLASIFVIIIFICESAYVKSDLDYFMIDYGKPIVYSLLIALISKININK